MEAPPAVGGNRLTWPEIPDAVRDAIEIIVDGTVVGATSQSGGFSPAMASVLTLADGRTAFAKAVGVERNDFSFAAIRREIEVLGGLPAHVPAPTLLGSYDDGDWVALVSEAVDGRTPAQPWRRDELDRFLDATAVLADALAPAPIAADRFADLHTEFTRWSTLFDDPGTADRLDPEFHAHAGDLVRMERHWAEAVDGDSLLHGDLRADNFLLTGTGFTVVDWPSVVIGAPWIDLFYALPSISMQAGGDPDALWSAHPLSRGVPPEAVHTALAGGAGFFISRSLEPPVPLIPTIRRFQRAQGLECFRWLAARLGW